MNITAVSLDEHLLRVKDGVASIDCPAVVEDRYGHYPCVAGECAITSAPDYSEKISELKEFFGNDSGDSYSDPCWDNDGVFIINNHDASSSGVGFLDVSTASETEMVVRLREIFAGDSNFDCSGRMIAGRAHNGAIYFSVRGNVDFNISYMLKSKQSASRYMESMHYDTLGVDRVIERCRELYALINGVSSADEMITLVHDLCSGSHGGASIVVTRTYANTTI